MITADCHLHTSFSTDSDAPMEAMLASAVRKGLSTVCFTEHLDYDYPPENGEEVFLLDLPAYCEKLLELRERFRGKIEVLFGVELGMMPYLGARCEEVVRAWPFDFVIASSHLEGVSEEEAYASYFRTIPANVRAFSSFHTYAHLDYVVRYGPHRNERYSYEKYREAIEPALRILIENGKALEVNTGGYRSGLGQPNPHLDVLRAYRELGGELITIGSDAHAPEGVALEFDRLSELLPALGFTHYAVFKGGKPELRPF